MKKIVRIRKVDLPGDKKVGSVICKIKGINFMTSNALLHSLNIDKHALLGDLSDSDVEHLKTAIDNPSVINMPKWLLNRRNDLDTGVDMHLTGMDLPLKVREDVKVMQETRSYKGFRHGAGLKVRGQRTKAHPRKGSAVGVITKKKAAKMQKKPESGGDKK